MSIAESAFIHPTSVVDDGAAIGKETSVWHFSHIMSKARIGNYCSLGQNVFVADNVVLKNGVKVQNNVSIYEGVICEDDVFLGPSMVFTNVINPRSAVSRKNEYQQTLVQKGASIGANATIVCGNTLGRYSFIGAGAVITKDVADFALVAGVPAQRMGWVSKAGRRLEFNDQQRARCPETGEEYTLKNNKVELLG